MTLFEARDILYRIVARYFGDGHVYFSEVKKPVKVEPYITIKMSDTSRPVYASKLVDDNGFQKSYRELSSMFEINLYTKGKDVSQGRGIPVYLNTAVNDMNGFVNYLESDGIIELMSRLDVSINLSGNVRDLSALQMSNSTYQYRALLEGEMKFMDVAYGRYGQNDLELPSDSGGGSFDLITDSYEIDTTTITGGVVNG